MLRSKFTLFGAACCAFALLAAGAHAAQKTKTIPMHQLPQRFEAAVDNTDNYFPQIDNSIQYQPFHPENPLVNVPVEPSDPYQGPAPGRSQAWTRGHTGPRWPAIGYTTWYPPDCDLAVGPNAIVCTVNQSIGFFSKTGTNTFLQAAPTFFSGMGAGSFQFDPKCFYDRIAGRFVILFLEEDDASQTSKLLIAVSDDNNPTGTWFKYRVEAKLVIGGAGYWLDYPGLGYNKDAYVVNGNMFGFGGGFAGVKFLVMPKTPLLSGGAAVVNVGRDSAGASAQTCEIIDPTFDKIFAVSRNGTSSLKVYALSNLTTNPPTLQTTTVAVPAFSLPSRGANSTNGRTLDAFAGDGRVFTTMWRGGKLMCTHNVQSGNIRVRWDELNTNSWPTSGSVTQQQSGDISGTSDFHMGAINRNANGDVGIICSRSSTTITADIVQSSRAFADPAGTTGAPVLFESSAGNNYGLGRWGDYFGCDVDPNDDLTFWGIGMDVSSANAWKTSVFSWTVSSAGPTLDSVTLDSNTANGGDVVGGHVNLTGNAVNATTVDLSSNNTSVATVPPNVVVPVGSSTAPFNVTTFNVMAPTVVTITATLGSVMRTVQLTVNPAPIIIHPTAFSLSRGIVLSGGLPEIQTSNDQYLTMRPGVVLSSSEAPIQMVVDGTSTLLIPTSLRFHIESAANQANIGQTIAFFSPFFGTYTDVDSRTITTTDTGVDVVITSSPEQYIDGSNGAVRAKISYKAVGPVLSYPWQVRVDELHWQVTQ